MGLTYSSELFEMGFEVREISPAGLKEGKNHVMKYPWKLLPSQISIYLLSESGDLLTERKKMENVALQLQGNEVCPLIVSL